MDNSRKWLLGIVAVAIIIVIVIVAEKRKNTGSDSMSSVSPSASASPSVSAVTSQKPIVTAKLPASYSEAIKQYEGKRIQFDTACQASPTKMVLKAGTTIMLDNRSSVKRIISIGATKYTVIAWGYYIMTPRGTGALPQTILVDCGASQNVATLLIQK